MAFTRSSIKELREIIQMWDDDFMWFDELVERIDKLKLSNTMIYSVEQYVKGVKLGDVATITWMTTLDS